MARIGYDEALAAQPAVLPASAAAVTRQLDRAKPALRAGSSVCAIGMGASTHAARFFAALLRQRGCGATALSASEVCGAAHPSRSADLFVLVSESGDSAEIVDAARRLSQDGAVMMAVTNAPGSALAELVPNAVFLDCGPDSGVYTVGFTATLQALILLADRLGAAPAAAGPWTGDALAWDALIGDVVSHEEAYATIAARLSSCTSIDVVGGGIHGGVAHQAALMLREGARLPAAAFDTREYLHGPMESLEPTAGACLVIGAGRPREARLARFCGSLGVRTVAMDGASASLQELAGTDRSGPGENTGGSANDEVSEALATTIAVQYLVRAMARSRGVPLGSMRYRQSDTKVSGAY